MTKPKRSGLPAWLSAALAAVFIMTGVAVTALMFLTAEAFLGRPLNPLAESAEAVSDVELTPMPQIGTAPVPTILVGQPTPTAIPTSELQGSTERVNILVMGIDRRPGESFISRTDSMMLISIDPQTEEAAMLSIPRDLYVLIPGHGKDRINTAFVYGSAGDNPLGGAAMAMNTVEYNLGVPVDHYVLIDFSAVIKGIDTLGGVDVIVPFDIDDPTYPDMNYGFDPLYIPAGLQHMDGQTALKYARTRHVDNDFGRAYRQQQLLMAARDKALGLGIAGLLTRAPELYARVEQGIRTDLSLEQIVQLARAASDIDSDSIRSIVLDQNYVSPFITENGAQVLVLDPQATTPLINDLFYSE